MPRRVAVYAPEYQGLNMLISISAFVLGISTFILLGNVIYSLRQRTARGREPLARADAGMGDDLAAAGAQLHRRPGAFKNPYGYGTQAAYEYLNAIDAQYGAPEEPPPTRELTTPKPAPRRSGD